MRIDSTNLIRRALVLLFTCSTVLAIGPRIKFTILTWTPSPSVGVSGYWLYYRTGTTAYDDSRRFPVSTNSNTLDLMTLALTPGSYAFAMTSTNLTGDESGLSNEATWNSAVPIKPVITGILAP